MATDPITPVPPEAAPGQGTLIGGGWASEPASRDESVPILHRPSELGDRRTEASVIDGPTMAAAVSTRWNLRLLPHG